MTHYTEDDLILYYYEERPRSSGASKKIALHLDVCERCAAVYRSLAATLRMIDTPDAPERGEQYGLEVWQRIRGEVGSTEFSRFSGFWKFSRFAKFWESPGFERVIPVRQLSIYRLRSISLEKITVRCCSWALRRPRPDCSKSRPTRYSGPSVSGRIRCPHGSIRRACIGPKAKSKRRERVIRERSHSIRETRRLARNSPAFRRL